MSWSQLTEKQSPNIELTTANLEEKSLTPLLLQYKELKSQNPNAILLFRCGDFYEMFFEDAIIASKELQITLTSRGKTSTGQNIPLAGVPYHSVMSYIAKLVHKGYTVAICEQMEDPKQAKGLVKREVVRIITPGTIADPQLLDESANNWLCAFGKKNDEFCLASVELSTGDIIITSGDKSDYKLLSEELLRLDPKEILILETTIQPNNIVKSNEIGANQDYPWKNLEVEVHKKSISYNDAVSALSTLFPKEPKSKLQNFSDLETKVLGILAEYLYETQKCSLLHLKFPQSYKLGDAMVLDEPTLRNLELLPTTKDKSIGGNLFDVINRTQTSMGARLLKRWLLKPLIQVQPIVERQNIIELFYNNYQLLVEIREILKNIPDIERLLSRIILGSKNPRDAQALGRGISSLPKLHEKLINIIPTLAHKLQPIPELQNTIQNTLNETLPPTLNEGGVIAKGVNPELDELRSLLKDGDRWLLEYEEKERIVTGIKTLKVRKNNVFGYFIEISKGLVDKAPPHYIRKQTLTTGERFITAELKEYESKITTANEKAIALEKEIYEKLIEKIKEYIPTIQSAASSIAEVDVFTSLAWLAREKNYVKPIVENSEILEIKAGRHPVVESFMNCGEFQPNDTLLNDSRKQAIITGPNMAGKSTYLRQNALIVLLAQIGSFVPAQYARIGIVDRIFTRVGASDNLVRGQSTFMVEMIETANILRNATHKSLLILDEIGRGTSTFDGLALAWAILEYINQHIKARTLFATHYHELTDLVTYNNLMFNLNVAVNYDSRSGSMVFLHQIQEGPSNKSYGIEVANLAGLPRCVIDRAREILFELEKNEQTEVNRLSRIKRSENYRNQYHPLQLSLFQEDSILQETIKSIDINNITPLQALNLLAKLKELVK